MSNIAQRTITGICLAILIIYITYYGGFLFAVLALGLGYGVIIEYQNMMQKILARSDFNIAKIIYVLFATLCFLSISRLDSYLQVAIIAYVLYVYFCLYKLKTHNIYCLFGWPYIVFSIIFMIYNRLGYDNGFIYTIYLFLVVWGSDIGGYFVGKKIGGRKLAPSISPNKTISGALGGLVLAELGALFLYFQNSYVISLSFLFFAPLLSIISQIGDLFESQIKRSSGIKDSGNILPGHGGIFDRVDGLLASNIALGIYLLLINYKI